MDVRGDPRADPCDIAIEEGQAGQHHLCFEQPCVCCIEQRRRPIGACPAQRVQEAVQSERDTGIGRDLSAPDNPGAVRLKMMIHVWTTPVGQERFSADDDCLVRFIHVSGLFARRDRPLAMMVSVDRILITVSRSRRGESRRLFRSPA
jgi:hypothetical protein